MSTPQRPHRNLAEATPGQITATPPAVLHRLAIRVMKVRGVVAKRGRR